MEPESLERSRSEPAQRYAIPARLAGVRLDAALAELAGASRAQVQRWIAEAAPALHGGLVHRVWRAAPDVYVVLVRHHEGRDPTARVSRRE